jgi:hypothetical protein
VNAVAAVITQPLQTYRDHFYAVSVGVGTPAQPLLLRPSLADTSWVAATNCTYCCVSQKYNPSASTSGGQITKYNSDCGCSQVVEVLTLYGADQKTPIGIIENFDLNVVDTAGRDPDNMLPFDGILNLAEVANKALANKSIPAAYYSVYTKPTCTNDISTSDAGRITYGGADDVNCGAVLDWLSYDKSGSLNTKLDALTIGTSPATTLTDATVDIDPFLITTLVTNDTFNAIVKAWNVKGSGPVYTVDCAPSPVPGPLTFTINNKPYAFPYSHFVRKNGDVCELLIFPNTVEGVSLGNWFSIGVANAFCTMVDLTNAKFGLAPLKVAQTGVCSYKPVDMKKCSGDPTMSTTPSASVTIASSSWVLLTLLALGFFNCQ